MTLTLKTPTLPVTRHRQRGLGYRSSSIAPLRGAGSGKRSGGSVDDRLIQERSELVLVVEIDRRN